MEADKRDHEREALGRLGSPRQVPHSILLYASHIIIARSSSLWLFVALHTMYVCTYAQSVPIYLGAHSSHSQASQAAHPCCYCYVHPLDLPSGSRHRQADLKRDVAWLPTAWNCPANLPICQSANLPICQSFSGSGRWPCGRRALKKAERGPQTHSRAHSQRCRVITHQ
ncbi:hypothetical protein F4780DRAFT_37738 [Xylariomycetidae sp. FL0641]|nr:hypothetical protein F4780DRAFT_37738 [Xylariomycetidae sp. FL0641]